MKMFVNKNEKHFTKKKYSQMDWVLWIFWTAILVLSIRPHKSQNLDDDLCGCDRKPSKPASRLFNGTVAGKNEFSFVANIFFSSIFTDSNRGPQRNRHRLFKSYGTAVILNSQWFLSVRSGKLWGSL